MTCRITFRSLSAHAASAYVHKATTGFHEIADGVLLVRVLAGPGLFARPSS